MRGTYDGGVGDSLLVSSGWHSNAGPVPERIREERGQDGRFGRHSRQLQLVVSKRLLSRSISPPQAASKTTQEFSFIQTSKSSNLLPPKGKEKRKTRNLLATTGQRSSVRQRACSLQAKEPKSTIAIDFSFSFSFTTIITTTLATLHNLTSPASAGSAGSRHPTWHHQESHSS